MSRIPPAPPERYVPLFGADAPLRLRIFAQRPELAKAYAAFGKSLREERNLPDRLVELVRLRVGFWNQCRSCMAIRYEDGARGGVTEELVCSLERPEEAPDLTGAERAAIAFADLLANDHLAIGDETFEHLREHFTDPEIVELCFNVALFVGFGRMSAALNMVDELPEGFRAEGETAPWRQPELVHESGRTAPPG